jgi:glycosyltransferase involved in cell wall biosynthesis
MISESLKVRALFSGYIENPFQSFDVGDLLVVPSRWEGDGLVVLEAIKFGAPLLISDIPDFRRFNLAEKHYFRDANDLTRLILDCEDVSEYVVSQDERDRILKERNVKTIAENWLNLIARVAK